MEVMRRIRMLEHGRLLEQFLLEDFDLNKFLDKARSVMMLARRGDTEGERAAGKLGMQRLMARAEAEIKTMRAKEKVTKDPNQRKALHDQTDRFLAAMETIQADDKPEPPKKPPPLDDPKFKAGQWIVHLDDGTIGKILKVKRSTRDGRIVYDIRMADGQEEMYREVHLRAATQEDLDAAFSQRPTKPLFDVGDYVIWDDDQMGQIAENGGWDRDTKSRYYEVNFLDGEPDTIGERYLRKATIAEVEAKLRPKSPPPGSNTKLRNDILAFARYVNPLLNSNKVYGVVERNGKFHTFWGGYQKALATKSFGDRAEAFQVFRSKVKKGYRETPLGNLNTWLDDALNLRFSKLGEARRYATALRETRREIRALKIDAASRHSGFRGSPAGQTRTAA